jgi:hypothetical protein
VPGPSPGRFATVMSEAPLLPRRVIVLRIREIAGEGRAVPRPAGSAAAEPASRARAAQMRKAAGVLLPARKEAGSFAGAFIPGGVQIFHGSATTTHAVRYMAPPRLRVARADWRGPSTDSSMERILLKIFNH